MHVPCAYIFHFVSLLSSQKLLIYHYHSWWLSRKLAKWMANFIKNLIPKKRQIPVIHPKHKCSSFSWVEVQISLDLDNVIMEKLKTYHSNPSVWSFDNSKSKAKHFPRISNMASIRFPCHEGVSRSSTDGQSFVFFSKIESFPHLVSSLDKWALLHVKALSEWGSFILTPRSE